MGISVGGETARNTKTVPDHTDNAVLANAAGIRGTDSVDQLVADFLKELKQIDSSEDPIGHPFNPAESALEQQEWQKAIVEIAGTLQPSVAGTFDSELEKTVDELEKRKGIAATVASIKQLVEERESINKELEAVCSLKEKVHELSATSQSEFGPILFGARYLQKDSSRAKRGSSYRPAYRFNLLSEAHGKRHFVRWIVLLPVVLLLALLTFYVMKSINSGWPHGKGGPSIAAMNC
jgi:hypothetical protein